MFFGEFGVAGEEFNVAQGKNLWVDVAVARDAALVSQHALAFELQEALNFIGYQYWEMKYEGLLGAEKLLFDIERLEQHRLERADREARGGAS